MNTQTLKQQLLENMTELEKEDLYVSLFQMFSCLPDRTTTTTSDDDTDEFFADF